MDAGPHDEGDDANVDQGAWQGAGAPLDELRSEGGPTACPPTPSPQETPSACPPHTQSGMDATSWKAPLTRVPFRGVSLTSIISHDPCEPSRCWGRAPSLAQEETHSAGPAHCPRSNTLIYCAGDDSQAFHRGKPGPDLPPPLVLLPADWAGLLRLGCSHF